MIIDPIGKNTYKDYLTYEENERIELMEGKIYNMAPAPSRIHQKLVGELFAILYNHIKSNKGSCEVYTAPFDVILKDNKEDVFNSKNVVQPDISVICDKSNLTDKGCTGAPDMVVEVVSPYNPSNDYIKKAYLYELYGVREYWIVNPMNRTIQVYTLENGSYCMPATYTFSNTIKVNIFNGLEINFSKIDLD